MIKSNKGMVEVWGKRSVIASDLECIIHALLIKDVFSEEEIMMIVENGFKEEPKKDEPSKEEISEEVLELLRKIVGEMEE